MVFIDYQNVYRGARDVFHTDRARPQDGQIRPLELAQHLTARSPFNRRLIGVRVYRGRPDSHRDPAGYGANRRQSARWQVTPLVTVISRTLRYPFGWPAERPEEKGIDVALAVDFVVMALRGKYDIGIVMSTDTDLEPALEAVVALSGRPFPRAEVAAWSMPGRHSRRLAVKGAGLWCHWLDEADYRSVADSTDYRRVT